MPRENQSYNPIDQVFSQKLVKHSSSYSPAIWENVKAGIIAGKKSYKPVWILGFLGLIIFLLCIASLFVLNSKKELNVQEHIFSQQILDPSSSATSISDNQLVLLPESNEKLLASSIDKESIDQAIELEESQIIRNSQNIEFQKEKDITHEMNLIGVESNDITDQHQHFELSVSNPAHNSLRATMDVAHIPSADFNLYSEEMLNFPKLFNRKVDPSECPTFAKRSKGEMSVDVYYSSDLPLRRLTAVNSEFDSYALAREDTETELYSFSIGARAAYHVSPNIALRAGLHFSQINERFNFEDPDAQQVQTIITIDSVFMNGMWEITRDTQSIRLTGVNEIQHYNRYRMLDIPIMLSYEYAGNRFDLDINGGIMLNLLFKQKGRFLNPSLMPTSFDSSDPDQFNAFKSNIGLSLYGSFTFAYKLNSNWSILIEPNMRHYINQVTLSSYPLKQSYTTVGLLTGVRYHF